MNEILREYYDIKIDYYREYNDGIVFFVNGDYFYFFKTFLSSIDVESLYKIYLSLKRRGIVLHDYVFNNNNEILSNQYVLIKLNYLITDIDISDISRLSVMLNEDVELKDDFINNWLTKIDYLEKQVVELSNNQLVNNSFDYFVGIAEALLTFYQDNYSNNNDNYLVHTCFRTLNTIDFYNPINLSVGNKYKDIVSYIKLTNNWELLGSILDVVDINDRFYIFIRLCFPFEYFLSVNSFLVDSTDEKEILNIINRLDEYERYLNKIDDLFGYKLFYWTKKDN